MISMTFSEIASIVDGELVHLSSDASTNARPVIDSREVGPGTFFCAFKGSQMDGNNFAAEAISHGAEFILTEDYLDLPSIRVANVQDALTVLARHAREQSRAKVIGITGSQGKTTTKELLKAILQTAGSVVAPAGSFNNELGLPLTILSADDATQFIILEMGARHRGDIAHLCLIARPDIGAVLVVGTAHLGEFGSQAALAATKGELIDALSEDGIAVLGDYDEYTPQMGASRSLQRIIFGERGDETVRAADIEIRSGRAHFDLVTPDGRARASLRLIGAHHIANALAAAAIAHACGVGVDAIAAALSTAESFSKWRMELHEVDGVTIINDAYNANPESMAAALRTASLLAQESGGSTWAFLGKMHELGASEGESHREIGRLASALHVDQLVQVGGDFYSSESELGEMEVHNASDREDALRFLPFISTGDVILVKASRAEGLEKLAEAIEEGLLDMLRLTEKVREE